MAKNAPIMSQKDLEIELVELLKPHKDRILELIDKYFLECPEENSGFRPAALLVAAVRSDYELSDSMTNELPRVVFCIEIFRLRLLLSCKNISVCL